MIRTDGGLGTALIARGLPTGVAADTWVDSHPDEVAVAQRAFVEAGSRIVLTATFRAGPSDLTRIDRAVAIAVASGGTPWGCIGPSDDPEAVAAVAARLWSHEAVEGLVIETITNLAHGVANVAAVARLEVRNGPIVASVAPRSDGRTWDGEALIEAFRRLTSAGADVVGFNCGDGVPAALAATAIARTWARPWWAKPGALPGEDPLPALRAAEEAGATYVGGCCGVTAAHLAAHATAMRTLRDAR